MLRTRRRVTTRSHRSRRTAGRAPADRLRCAQPARRPSDSARRGLRRHRLAGDLRARLHLAGDRVGDPSRRHGVRRRALHRPSAGPELRPDGRGHLRAGDVASRRPATPRAGDRRLPRLRRPRPRPRHARCHGRRQHGRARPRSGRYAGRAGRLRARPRRHRRAQPTTRRSSAPTSTASSTRPTRSCPTRAPPPTRPNSSRCCASTTRRRRTSRSRPGRGRDDPVAELFTEEPDDDGQIACAAVTGPDVVPVLEAAESNPEHSWRDADGTEFMAVVRIALPGTTPCSD